MVAGTVVDVVDVVDAVDVVDVVDVVDAVDVVGVLQSSKSGALLGPPTAWQSAWKQVEW